MPTKPKLKPPQRCKPLGWNRIILNPNNEEMNSSIWKSINEQDVKMDEIWDSFSIKKVAPKVTSINSTLSVKSEKVTFLNAKRAQSVGITIAKLPAISTVSLALETMDSTLLSSSNVESLNREYIKDDEIEEYKHHKNNNENTIFEKGEEYLISLYNITNSKEKLEIWQFINDYDDQLPKMEKMIKIVNLAIDKLKNDETIKLLFSYVLTVGNIINGGTEKGQADGFDLNSLSKLKDTKGKNGQSLLQYMCQLIVNSHPDFRNISEKFEEVKNALDYSFIETPKNCKRVVGNSRELENNIKALKNNDKFKENAETFLIKFKNEKTKIKSEISDIESKYKNLMSYFCVNSKENIYNNPDELFKLFNNFFKDIDSAMPKIVEKKAFVPKHNIGDRVGIQRDLISKMMKMNAIKKSS